MYAQVEKPKENSFPMNRHKSWAVANAVAQKKSNVKQGFWFVDNRPETKSQKSLQMKINGERKMVLQPKQNKNTNNQNVIQRFVAIAYGAGTASATITHADLGTGSAATVAAGLIPSHAEVLVPGIVGAAHPYHHQRGHLIGRQLGGDGGDVNNLVGLSDGTNAPLMADIEGEVRDILTAEGAGSSVWVQVTVSYVAGDYAGPPAAPHVAGMVGKISYDVYDHAPPGNSLLYRTEYPNGVVKNHHAAGCC